MGCARTVYPVGRLDFDSDGLLLLTNDGELAAALIHPRHEVDRVYRVQVAGVPGAKALAALVRGVPLDGRRTAPAEVTLVHGGREGTHGSAVLTITLREGRNRQIRRMCEAVGHPVERLTRIRIGPIADAGLRTGQVRDLTDEEVRRLKAAAGRAGGDNRRRR